jgi:hypothetical protein
VARGCLLGDGSALVNGSGVWCCLLVSRGRSHGSWSARSGCYLRLVLFGGQSIGSTALHGSWALVLILAPRRVLFGAATWFAAESAAALLLYQVFCCGTVGV